MNEENLDLANAVALGILDDDEREALARIHAEPDSRFEFTSAVRQAREMFALVAFVTLATPPPALRDRIMSKIAEEPRGQVPLAAPIDLASRRTGTLRWRYAVGAAAAAVALVVGGAAIGTQLRGTEPPSTTESVLAASDARSANVALPVGGAATVVYSRDENAAIVLLNNVGPPAPESVYQLWLLTDGNATSAGIVDPDRATDSITAVVANVGSASSLAFTVEPTGGSAQPTTPPFAKIALA
ncbi:anti-sigma factor domain-containing protein [Antrihabitans sp. NCIMB 15449]|jgi:anti-sigma-K factor RskA|uniref:Regulator of SigK n=1 Tax=Antrihabitans spumae TaxID=3373370 RepID=A0ABW7JLK7_9NOCA